MLELGVAALTLAAVVAYAVLGGADFGGGIWDAAASGPRKAAQRDAIAEAMGPVWEANHVWLIFVIVLLFSAFPSAYSALSVALFVPFHFVLLGIILRGAAFVFRAYSPESARSLGPSRQAKRWGALFGMASVMTPVLLGMCLGAVSAGGIRIAPGSVTLDGLPWLAPVSLAMGAFALAMCAYLAAVFLAYETTGELREDFRARALWAGTTVVALSVLLLPLLATQAGHLWRGLFEARTLPVLVVGIVTALASGWFLRTRRYRLARVTSVAQVACLVAGWGLAQYPYLVFPDLTLYDAAAPDPMLRFLLFTLPLGLALLLPSLWLLFRVFKGRVV